MPAAANPKSVIIWLYISAALVFIMALIGATTRLSESGLSMVEWRPLMGALPPLNDAEWQRVFTLYQSSPQFIKQTFWMDLGDFKQIFFWEWFHRLLGRMIGVVYGLPLFYFWCRGKLPTAYKPRLFFILMLGGMQGLMGWYMVQSGLVDNPAVSHFRLAAHLGLAFFIFAALVWSAQDIQKCQKVIAPTSLYVLAWITAVLLIAVMIWGAFVAGLDAGLVYNEFPLMGGAFLPPDAINLSPLLLNFLYNPVAIQFLHRWLAICALGAVIFLHVRAQKAGIKTWEVYALPVIVTAQVSLGIVTLLTQVHLPVAVAHQGGALCVLGAMTVFLRRIR